MTYQEVFPMHIKKIIALPLAAVMMSGAAAALPASAASTKTNVQIKTVSFSKVSSKKIKLSWSDAKDTKVKTYTLQRYNPYTQNWNNVATIKSDGINGNGKHTYTDTLTNSSPQQYKYRVNVKVSNTKVYRAVKGTAHYASNIKVCIDPGHFSGKNGGTSGYTEGDATIKIGLALRDLLKKEGISVYMTRTDGNITLGGQWNVDDGSQLTARGAAAANKKCDMFISLHTNANNMNANGKDTIHQPKTLNKTVVFVNYKAYQQNGAIVKAAEKAGEYVTSINKQLGIPTNEWAGLKSGKPYYYCTASGAGTIYNDDFTAYNDGLKQKGRVIYRALSGKPNDYYAVLRAASNNGIPGILIEHSYHTVPAFCKKFMSSEYVAKYYGLADARAIAIGYGFKALSTLPEGM